MLVYGDRSWSQSPCRILGAIRGRLLEAAALGAGIERHARLVHAWVEAGQLVQGVADAEFEARGQDESSEPQTAAMALLMALSREVIRSWDGGFYGRPQEAMALLPRVAASIGGAPIRVRLPEGHAFYALYPEAYREAARALQSEPGVRVVGLRSIGAGLAAIVAAALGAPDPITLRPVGDPHDRRVVPGSALARTIAADADSLWAIVDEGPGQSGSSLACTAEMLMALGVPEDRIHVFSSHADEPGAAASPRHRAWWRRAMRHVQAFEDWALQSRPGHALGEWVADLIGEPIAPMEDLSGGCWRRFSFAAEKEWPPVWPQQERRKYRMRTMRGTWLLKFAGLGEEGARKFARARSLAAAGFTPEIGGLRHGFLVERWREDSRPLSFAGFPRPRLIERVGKYLGFRAAHFPAQPGRGASLDELREMVRRNLSLALGEPFACATVTRFVGAPVKQFAVRAIETDGKLQAWEWIVAQDGALLKTDAVDHHAAHDLIGCQDVSWDIAGAAIELQLTPGERDAVARNVERACGRGVDRNLSAMMEIAYVAFQIGRCRLASDTVRGDGAERARLLGAAERYETSLRSLLS